MIFVFKCYLELAPENARDLLKKLYHYLLPREIRHDLGEVVERFNRTCREEVLSSYLFEDLDQVREITHDWLITYNERRPHDALGGLPPLIFRKQKTAKISTYELST